MTNDNSPRPLLTRAWALAIGLLGVSLAGALASGVPTFEETKQEIQVATGAKSGGNTTISSGKGGKTTTTSGGSGGGTTVVALPPTKPGLECARGRNGGSTDKGVSGDEIKLAATVVKSGIAKAFLGDVGTAMQAVVDKTNAAGGICGRTLKLKTVDDGWDPQLGAQMLRSLMAENPFALPVVPSSEGLRIIIDSDKNHELEIPIVGTDGMLVGQYQHPMVWPVAASTVSAMHVMVDQAWKRGARTFGLVYEWTYHFGVEGAYAFNQAVKRKTGKDVPGYSHPSNPKCEGTFCAIQAGQPGYGTQVATFNEHCRQPNPASPNDSALESCDLVALLLEPATAQTWIANGGARPNGGRTMGPPPLFNTGFARVCGKACDDIWVWSGYRPPLAPFDDLPAVRTYVADVKRRSASIDTMNSFTIGGYVGMNLFVEAARQVGPELTRHRLAAVLDTMTYDSGIAPPLKWGKGDHFANDSLLAYRLRYSNNTFAGFQPVMGFVKDPWIGMDTQR